MMPPSSDTTAGQILGCAVSFGRVPVGVRTWLARRWFGAAGVESGAGFRDYTLRLQTAADTPDVVTWRQQPRRDKVLQLLGQQVTVGHVNTGGQVGGQVKQAHTPAKVRIETQGTVVWLDLHDRHATLTLDTLTLNHVQPDSSKPDSSKPNQPDIPDINVAAAARGVWQGELSPYPLVIALHEALRTAGWLPVHGACAHVGGEAVLFLGASGTGKTTTLVRALQAGWEYVAEDVVWVDADTLAVQSLERGVRLFAGDVAQLEPRLAGADLGELVMGKAFIAKETLSDLYSTPSTHATTDTTDTNNNSHLRHVVQLVRTTSSNTSSQAKTTWQPLNKQHAAVALWQGLGLPLTARVQQQVAGWLPRGLQQVQAWQLTLGDDVREVLAAGLPSDTTDI